MDDNSIMPFGKHKGEKMANVPDDYLDWYWGENEIAYYGRRLNPVQTEIMEYIEENLPDKRL